MNATRRYPRPENLPDPLPASLILDASAGTGKTFALEHIVLDLLLRPQTEGAPLCIHQILVSTFTEKAAGEMRERIRVLIEKLLLGDFKDAEEGGPCWILDEAAKLALDQARMHFDRATITTIHGFCHNLLRETAFLTGEPFQTELVDGRSFFLRTVHECIRRRWAVSGSGREQDIERILKGFASEDAFAKYLYQVRGLPGSRYPEYPDAQGAIDRFLAAFDSEDLKAILKGRGVSPQAISPLLKNLETIRAAAAMGDHAALVKCLVPVLEKDGKGPTALFELAVSKDAAHARARKTALALLDLHASLPSPSTEVVDLFLADACAYAEELKEREGLLDFDDMARRVAKALEVPAIQASLGKAMQSRYKAVLLDEFQDTSPEQWQVFLGLFQGEGRIFLIGDPKQAIYGFRGGDVHTYLGAQKLLRSQGTETVRLERNFRSTPSMIEAYNTILDQGIDPPFFTGAIKYPVPVLPGKAGLRWVDPAEPRLDLPPIRLVRTTIRGNPSLPNLRRDVARHLARDIRELLLKHPELQNGEEKSPFLPGDVFVLTRTMNESRVIQEALREAGVPATFYRKDKVFQSQEAADLLSVLLAVAEPGDAARRARAFLTPVFGVELTNLRGAQDLPDGHPFVESLRAWNDLARSGRFGELFRLIVDGGILCRLLRQEQDDQAASIWLQLTDFMLEQCNTRKGNFREAVASLADCIAERVAPPTEEASLHRAATDQSAVQILTMHKAKGLEAKVVVLFGGLRPFPASNIHRFAVAGRSHYWLGKTPSSVLKGWIERELKEEGQRLLYVALTRAQAQLILPVFVAEGKIDCDGMDSETGDPKGDYGVLNRRLRAILEAGEHRYFEVVDLNPARPEGASFMAPDHSSVVIPEPPDPSFWDEVEPSAAFESFTSLSRDLRESGRVDPESHPGPTENQGVPGGTGVGICLHSILERVPLGYAAEAASLDEWLRTAEVASAVQDALLAAGLKENLRRGIANLAFQTLRSTFLLPGGQGKVPVGGLGNFARELSFLMKREGTVDYLEGSIDLLFEWEGRTYFVDWKSNLLSDYSAEACSEALQMDYSLQFAIYTLAVCALLGIDNREAFEARFGGGIYMFLRGMPEAGQAGCLPSWSDVLAWKKALEEGREESIHVNF